MVVCVAVSVAGVIFADSSHEGMCCRAQYAPNYFGSMARPMIENAAVPPGAPVLGWPPPTKRW